MAGQNNVDVANKHYSSDPEEDISLLREIVGVPLQGRNDSREEPSG